VKDYYKILGVDRSASSDAIKQAYRRLASKHHPDKGGDKAVFQEIQEAYNVLGDTNQRQIYDNPMHAAGHPHFNFDSIFDMFGVNIHQGVRRQVPRISLWVGLRDVALGGPRTLAVQTETQVHNIEIDIPPGIRDGDTIRYPGLAPGNQDLVVIFRIRPEPGWQRDGTNLIIEKKISIWDLVLGTELPVSDITGAELVLTVPPETQPGSYLRLRGRGLPSRQLPGDRPNAPPGDLMVKIEAFVPKNTPDEVIESIRRCIPR
jgi:curved DNA-binding protein